MRFKMEMALLVPFIYLMEMKKDLYEDVAEDLHRHLFEREILRPKREGAL